MTETTNKRNIQKLQRILVDALEDVKAKDIQVFNTEHLTPLFERVIVATATSNRQTRALASSVRDAMRDNGLDKPRMEGEDNGEWVIVDCGDAVVHIMQADIRGYYRLEEIWGDKPVRLRLAKASSGVAKSEVERAATAKAPKAQAPVKKARAAKAATPGQAPARQATAKKSAPAKKAPVKTVVVKSTSARKPAAKKSVGKPSASGATAARKTVGRKSPAAKTPRA